MRNLVAAICIFLLPGLCFSQVGGEEDIRQLAIGQRWEYAHTGSRPSSMQPKVIDGQRIFQVIERVEEDNTSYWIIEESFTNDPEIVSRLHINDEKHLTAVYNYHVEKGMFLKMSYQPGIPWQAPALAVGEEKTYESSLILGEGELILPETVVFKRLADETVEVEAGTYVNCRRIQVSISCVMDFKVAKIPYQEKRDLWLHPDVKGTIKEVYKKEDMKIVGFTQKGYSTSSVLTSYTVQEKAEAILVNKEILEHDDSGMSLRTKLYLALFGALAVLLLLIVAAILGIRYFWGKAYRKRKQTLTEPEKAAP
jgi:hypothetical protein